MTVTVKDVAREAGVSQATVSYVVNNNPGQKISAATRQRVLDAVEKLGYLPSEAARALRKGSSDTVLLLLPDVPIGFTMAQLIESLTDALEPYGLKMATRRMRGEGPMTELWGGLRPIAIVVIGQFPLTDEKQMRAAGIHVISASYSPVEGRSATGLSQTAVGWLQVEHLAARGHRVIGYAAPDDSRVESFYRPRLEGVRSACFDRGFDDPEVIPLHLEADPAADAVARWREHGATAVAAYNDDTAFAVLAGLRRLGLTAPVDLAVIGVDNIPLAALAGPPLTTVDPNIPKLADHLANQVIQHVQGGPEPERFRPDYFTLVIRETT